MSKMKIVIDCFKLVKGSGKSIGIYNLTLNLVRNMASAGNHKIIVLGTKHNAEDFDIDGVKFVKVKYNPLNKAMCILWELFLVKKAIKKIKPQHVIFPRGYMPVKDKIFMTSKSKGASNNNSGKIGVHVIIHDMIPFYYDKNFYGVLNPIENFYIMWRLKASAKNATSVFTDSEYSKKEIMRIAKVDGSNINVVYPGYNRIDEANVSAENGRKLAGCDNYICAICSGLPHKNAEGVVKSYAEYHKNANEPLKLVIIGLADITQYSDILGDATSDVICIKYLEKDSDMHSVMAGSKVFWFLSRQEGFGFPPLEAMQLGVPVICSNASSLPEVVGDAAILVGPEDYKKVSEETIKLFASGVIDGCIQNGNANVNRFNWDVQVKKYIELL